MKRIEFPKHLNSLRSLMPQLLSILESKKEDEWYAFIWLEERSILSYTAAINESSSESLDRGMVFRIVVDGKNYETSTNLLDENHLLELAKNFRTKIESLHPHPKTNYYRGVPWHEEDLTKLGSELKDQLITNANAKTIVHFSPQCLQDPFLSNVTLFKNIAKPMRQELFELSQDYINKNPEFEKLADIKCTLRQEVITHVFVDREKNMSQVLPLTIFSAIGITKTGQYGRCLSGGLGGLEIAKFSNEDKDEVTLRAMQLAKAKRIAPGRYTVISGPDVTGVIAHEAFGHTQEGDTWMKGRSIAKNLHENKIKVGNNQASIINHPNMFSMEDYSYGSNGSYFFDHEGQLARPQTILDQGMLSLPMTDLTSSMRLNIPRTANGKRESWRRPLMVRQTNTYFTPGDKTLSELISMVKTGFLARWASGGMEDPKGGSLTAGTAYFEEIKDGKLTGEIFLGPTGGHIELSDPVFTLLDKIVAKTKSNHKENIPENKYGGCGKYHKEGVYAGCGGPYILWESINCG